ncbi:MAG: oligosaccharide repeat unit polymerase [Bacteroidales bacterium]|nr:oligosaccharide repeat unit polymerase [Bacteroidales bacterium]
MEYIVVAYTLFLLLLTRRLIRDVLSRFCLYSFLIFWGVSLFATCFNPLGMSSVSPRTYFILMLAMAGFWTGMYCYNRYVKYDDWVKTNENLLTGAADLSTSKGFMALYIISTFLLLKFAAKALIMAELNGGTIEYDQRIEMIFDGSVITQMYIDFVVTPLAYATYALLGISIMGASKRFMVFYILSPIFLVSFLILAGGRSIFVTLALTVMIVIVSMRATKTKFNLPRMLFIAGVPTILLLMLGMEMQTNYRKTGQYGLDTDALGGAIGHMGESFFTYSVIPIKMFDYALDHRWPDNYGTMNMGRATFAGADYLVCRGIGHVTGDYPWSTMKVVQFLQDTRIQISPKSKLGYNYCYTATFYNYLDFGLFGVFIMPMIFSFLFRVYIIKFQRHRALPDLLIICFGYFMMLMSLFNCYFIKTWALLYCLILILWSERCNGRLKGVRIKFIDLKKITI